MFLDGGSPHKCNNNALLPPIEKKIVGKDYFLKLISATSLLTNQIAGGLGNLRKSKLNLSPKRENSNFSWERSVKK